MVAAQVMLSKFLRRPLMWIRVRRAAGRLHEDRQRADAAAERQARETAAIGSSGISAAETDRMLAFARARSAPVDLLDDTLAAIRSAAAVDRFGDLVTDFGELRLEVDALPELLPTKQHR